MQYRLWLAAAAALAWTGAQASESAPPRPRADLYFFSKGWHTGACDFKNSEFSAAMDADLECLAKHHGDFDTYGMAGGLVVARKSCKAELETVSKRMTGCDPSHAAELTASYDAVMQQSVVEQVLEASLMKGHEDAADAPKQGMTRLAGYAACVIYEVRARRAQGRTKDDLVAEAKQVCDLSRMEVASFTDENLPKGATESILKLGDVMIDAMADAEMKSPAVAP